MKKKIYTSERKTREELADKHTPKNAQQRKERSRRLKPNSVKIEGDLDGYCKIVLVDKSE